MSAMGDVRTNNHSDPFQSSIPQLFCNWDIQSTCFSRIAAVCWVMLGAEAWGGQSCGSWMPVALNSSMCCVQLRGVHLSAPVTFQPALPALCVVQVHTNAICASSLLPCVLGSPSLAHTFFPLHCGILAEALVMAVGFCRVTQTPQTV